MVAKWHKQNIMKKEEKVYETPQVEIVEVEVERGFQASGDGTGETGGFDPN